MKRKNIFLDLYLGKYNGEERLINDPKYKEKMNKLCLLENSILSAAGKTVSCLFDKYNKINLELSKMEQENAFKNGFSLAFQLLSDINKNE